MIANNQPAKSKIIYIVWIALGLNLLMLAGNVILALSGEVSESFREFVRGGNPQWLEPVTEQLKNLNQKTSNLERKIKSFADLGDAEQTKRIFDTQMVSSIKLITIRVEKLKTDLESCRQQIEQMVVKMARLQEQNKSKSK